MALDGEGDRLGDDQAPSWKDDAGAQLEDHALVVVLKLPAERQMRRHDALLVAHDQRIEIWVKVVRGETGGLLRIERIGVARPADAEIAALALGMGRKGTPAVAASSAIEPPRKRRRSSATRRRETS